MRLPIELVASLWNLASGLVPTPPSSTSKGVLSSSTRTYLDDLRARYGVAGASISVVVSPKYREGGRWGEEVLSLGVADGKGSKVDEDSLFAIASNSKLLTALSVGLLIENRTRLPGGGYLDWDTKITDILPPEEWTLQDGYASDHVDITDLASMRSGMPSHNLAHVDLPAVENVKNMRNLRPTSEIREVWQYNNMHYYTLAHIVSVLSGKDYTAYVHEHILDPLNMTRTSYNVTTARSWGGLTDGFLHYNGNGTQCAEESPDSKHISPACIGTAKPIGWWNTGDCVSEAGPGGIVTCARDGVKWLRELLEPRILPPSVLAKLATPVMYSGVPSASRHLSAEMYGMAQAVVSYRGHEVVYHTGGLPGQSSIILRAPNDGVAIAIFTNDENFILPFYYTAAYRILDDVLGLDEPGLIEDALFAQMVSLVAPKQKLAGDAPAPVQVEGRYTDKGYGSLNVTKLRNKELHDLLIPQFAYNRLPTDRPIYVSAYDRLFTDYMVFTHANASTWHIAIAKIHWYDTRKGEQVFGLDFESTPEERGGAVPIVAAFGAGVAVVTDNGIGVFGGFSSPGPLAKLSPPVEEDVETRAEVWFKKVKSVA